MQYTAEDVECALYAQLIDGLNESMYDNKKTPFHVIYVEEANDLGGCVKDQKDVWIDGYGWGIEQTEWDFSKPEDRQILLETRVRPQLARYKHGKELLRINQLIMSEPWMCRSDWYYDEMAKGKNVTSPAIVRTAGYIATTEHFMWVVLAEKKEAA
jgi:hypothetical protein